VQELTNDIKTPEQSITTPTAVAPQVAQSITKIEVEKEDINFKVIKDDQSIKISGIFSSKEDIDALKGEYSKISDNIEEGIIVINENAQNSKITKLLSTLSEDFSKFKSGYLEYAAGKLTIDGIVDDKSIKQSIGDKALTVGNLFVENKIIVDEPKKVSAVEEKSETTLSKEVIQSKLNNLLKVKKVEFVYGKATLTSSGKKTVDEVYTVLNKYKDINIEVGGHTDSSGSQKLNKFLSQSRANAIKNYLISKGINSKRLKAVGYGESRPLVKNNSSKNRQINRRVEFKILGE
jgi:outer membrane protein OmpA-like peptidoglycan-associated protein